MQPHKPEGRMWLCIIRNNTNLFIVLLLTIWCIVSVCSLKCLADHSICGLSAFSFLSKEDLNMGNQIATHVGKYKVCFTVKLNFQLYIQQCYVFNHRYAKIYSPF